MLDEYAEDAIDTEGIQLALAGGPVGIDVEWFGNTRDLARLYSFMRGYCDPEVFAILSINQNASEETAYKWDYMGYKGGSEPGVLNLTWLLTDIDGEDRLLSLSWSNPEATLNESQLEILAQRILALPQ